MVREYVLGLIRKWNGAHKIVIDHDRLIVEGKTREGIKPLDAWVEGNIGCCGIKCKSTLY